MRVVKALVAIVVTFVLGFGFAHALVGRQWRGFVWLAAVPVAALLAAFVSPFLGLAVPVVAAIDAVFSVSRSEQPMRFLSLWPWILFVASLAVAGATRMIAVEAFKIPSSSMYPTIHIGDHVFVEKVTRLWRAPKRGELIVFEHPCRPQTDYVSRVIAIGGDSVEVRCNLVYVNGEPLPAKLVEDGAHCGYDDYFEEEDKWIPKKCSRYRETIGGSEHDIYDETERPAHDPQPAVRDFPTPGDAPSCAQMGAGAGETRPDAGKIVETKQADLAKPCQPQLHYVVPEGELFVLGDNRNNSADSRIWGSLPISHVLGRVTDIWWAREHGRIGTRLH